MSRKSNLVALSIALALQLTIESTQAADSFRLYRQIQAATLKGSMNDKQLGYLERIFEDRDQVAEMARLNDLAMNGFVDSTSFRAENHGGIDRPGALYDAFIAADIRSDVVYDFLKHSVTRIMKLEEPIVAPVGGRGRLYGWYWGDLGRAVLNMYEVTGERRYLELFFSSYSSLVELRDDRLGLMDDARRRIVKGWGTKFEKTGERSNEITTAGLIMLPATEFLLAFRDAPERQLYQQEYNDLRDMARETLFEFIDELEIVPGTNQGYFFHPVTGVVEALNHSHVYGAALANFYGATDDLDAKDTVEKLCAYFRRNLHVAENDSYIWAYAPVPSDVSWLNEVLRRIGWQSGLGVEPEPTWKAAVTMELVTAARRNGLCFSADDMARFAKTFNENIYRDVENVNQHVGYRNPHFFHEGFSGRENLDESIAGWAVLGDEFPEVSQRIRVLVARRPDMFEDGWLAGARPVVHAYALMRVQDKSRSH